MKHPIHLITPSLLAAICVFSPGVQAVTADDLRRDAPACKMPQVKRPKLPVDFEHDAPVEITADFNGDGWCDYALGVPYPINSQMNSYYLSELMLLGSASHWTKPFKGRAPFQAPISDLDGALWPRDRVDLTDIRMVYPKRPGPPYVLGLFAGKADEGLVYGIGSSCGQYISVHRWDDTVGAFKRVDNATRDVVL